MNFPFQILLFLIEPPTFRLFKGGKNASSKHLMFSSTEMKTWEDGWAYQSNVYNKHTFLAAITMISSAFLTTSPATTSRKARRAPKVEREQPLCCDSSPNPKPPRMRRSNQSAVSYCRIKDIDSYEKKFPHTPCGLSLKPSCTERDFNKDYCVQVFALMK